MPATRKRYTVKEKLDIIRWYRDNGRNLHQAEREFSVARKQIRLWDRDFEHLLAHGKGTESKKQRLGTNPAPRFLQLDEAVFEWFVDERAEGRAVSNYQLQSKGRELASQLRVENFMASSGWLRRWKQRYSVGIRQGTNDCQKLPSDYKERISAFLDSIRALRQRHEYTLFNIANMDQTMVRFDSPVHSTNAMVGEKTVRITNTGGVKKGCTVALCGTASGHKLPAYIIFKEKSGELSTRIRSSLTVPPNVRISATPNGWMTTAEVQKWMKRVWGPNIDDVRRLLTLDSYRPHTCPGTMSLFEKGATDIVTIPGGCTGLIQPMDTHVNKVFKQRMRQQWATWFQTAERNKKGNLIQPTRQNVIDWVSEAWNSVQSSTLIGAFLSCGLSNALSGCEDDLSCGLSNALSGCEDDLMSRRLREDVGLDVRDIGRDLQDELDATRANGILFDSDESDDETLLFGGFGPDD